MEEKSNILNCVNEGANLAYKIFEKLFHTNESIVKSRLDVYNKEIDNANEKLNDSKISKKEKKMFLKQKHIAIKSMEDLDLENKHFLNETLLTIGACILGLCKLVQLAKEIK